MSYILIPFSAEFVEDFPDEWRDIAIKRAHARAGRTDHSGTRVVVRMCEPYDTEWRTEGDPMVHPDFIDMYGLAVFFYGGVAAYA